MLLLAAPGFTPRPDPRAVRQVADDGRYFRTNVFRTLFGFEFGARSSDHQVPGPYVFHLCVIPALPVSSWRSRWRGVESPRLPFRRCSSTFGSLLGLSLAR